MGNFSPKALQAGLDYLATTDITPLLPNIKVPMLWINGADDPICPAKSIELLPEDSNYVIIPEAGHLPHWTRANEVRWMIEDFCRETSTS